MVIIRNIFAFFLVFSLALYILFVAESYPAILKAANVSYVDVSAVVSAANSGDTVVVPPGIAVWSSTLVITKGLILQGAGLGVTVISSSINDQFASIAA